MTTTIPLSMVVILRIVSHEAPLSGLSFADNLPFAPP
jgi:hypothetical protein